MSINTQASEGTIKISDDVIAVCAVNATLRTEGVASLAGGISNALSRNFLGKDLDTKGIKVNQTEEGVQIDVHIIVKYHVKIPAVAWDIQENVKNEVQSMTDLSVSAVNIHVQGVEIPPEEEVTNDEK